MKKPQHIASTGKGTTATIRAAIASKAPGTVFTTQDLLAEGLGASRTALDVALKRLVDDGLISRAARGLFYVPKRHPVIGTLSPRPEMLAEAIARRSGAELLQVRPDAANRLGLTTQVPARPIFYTTGRGGRRKIGNSTIEFRHRSPRLASADSVVATVIEALRLLGKRRAQSDAALSRLGRVLDNEQKRQIAKQSHLAPGWMQPILRSVASSISPSASTRSPH